MPICSIHPDTYGTMSIEFWSEARLKNRNSSGFPDSGSMRTPSGPMV